MDTLNKLQTSLLGLTMQIPKTKIQEFLVVKNIFSICFSTREKITEGKLISHAKWK